MALRRQIRRFARTGSGRSRSVHMPKDNVSSHRRALVARARELLTQAETSGAIDFDALWRLEEAIRAAERALRADDDGRSDG